jgi:hypothetical protein
VTNALVITYLSALTPGKESEEVPPVAYTDLTALLDYARASCGRNEEITVIVTTDACKIMNLPVNLADAAPFLDVGPGWNHGPAGPWITYRPKNASKRIHLGFWPWMANRPRDHSLFADLLTQRYTPPRVILSRLMDWYDYTGCPYRGIPGIAGTALLRQLIDARKDHPPLWHYAAPVVPAELEISRWRSPVPALHAENIGHLISYDANRAYLSAAGTVEVALDRLEHTRDIDFDASRPGWWLINADPWVNSRLLPDPLMRRSSHSTLTWVTTPTVKLLDEMFGDGLGTPGFTVVDSWTADKATRLFRGWAGCLNSMCVNLIPDTLTSTSARALLGAAKDSYRQTVGLMNREHGAVYRPDWHYAIIAQARCTMWRKLWRLGHATGRWPVSIATDAVTFQGLSNDPVDENPGLPLGIKLGEWKTKTSVVTR